MRMRTFRSPRVWISTQCRAPAATGFVLDFVWWNQDMYSNEQIVTKAVRAYPAARNASRPREGATDNLWKIFDEARGVARITALRRGQCLHAPACNRYFGLKARWSQTDEEIKAAETIHGVTSSAAKETPHGPSRRKLRRSSGCRWTESMLVGGAGEAGGLARWKKRHVFYVRPAQG